MRVSLAVILGLLLSAPMANACPKEPKCVCDCNAKCRYGETCKLVKVCKVYKACKTKKVCSPGKDVKCCKDKVKICHIPPGNPLNAHTICVGKPAKQPHLDHGDYLGKCHKGCKTKKVCHSKKCCHYVKKCKCNEYNPKCPPCICPDPDGGSLLPDMERPDMLVKKDVFVQKDSSVKKDVFVQKDAGRPDVAVKEDAGKTDLRTAVLKFPDAGVPDIEVIEVDGDCPVCPDEEPDLELVGGGCSVVSGDGGKMSAGLVIGFLLIVWGLVRRSKLSLIFGVLLLASVALGNAYAAPPVNNFKTAPSVQDYYTTMNPKTLGHLDFNTQLVLNYANKPLQVIDRATGDPVYTVVHFRMNVDLAMSLGLYDWFELGFVVPTSAGQGSGDLTPLYTDLSIHDFELADFKDLRIVPKVHFGSIEFDDASLQFGLALAITAPTGEVERLLGENGATLAPVLLAGLDHKYFDLSLNAGVLARFEQEHRFSNQEINHDNEFFYGAGLRVPLVKDFNDLRELDLIGDIWGYVQFNEQDKEEVGLEVMGGLRAHMEHGVVMNVAAGGGLSKGYGVPEYRIMWGFGWEFDYQKTKCPTCKKPKKCPPPKIVEKVVPKVVKRTLIIPPVYFDTDKHNLRPDAVETLDNTVKLLQENPWVKRVRLEGHCDFRASNKYNEALGWRRVYAVRNYLLNKGVKTELEPRGYGETQPVSNSKEEPGLQKNRRVELHVVEVTK